MIEKNSNLTRKRRKSKVPRKKSKHVKSRISNSKKEMVSSQLDTKSVSSVDNASKLKVRANLISKKFELSQNEKLKEFFGIGKSNRGIKDFWALRDVNFEVHDGEAIGIIGLNGSGKSTLLNIIDKSLSVTTGDLQINGEVSHIAIGAGLKIDLTGRDNIRLKGTMMGMSKKEIDDKMEEIIQFSELGPFIDRQVKDYSSGMRSKLAFSIAVNQDPDILIIDEALSVGDSTFAAKSSKKMFEFRERGKTIFVVSHNAAQIQRWTDKVLWLHYGEVKEYGATKDILPKYQTFINWFNKLSKEQQEQYKLDRRQEQLNYSVDAFKQEVIDNSTADIAQASLAIIDKTSAKSKKKSKLSWMSKFVMMLCVIFMGGMLVVSVKGGEKRIGLKQTQAHLPKTSVSSHQKASQKNSSSSQASTSATEKSNDELANTFDYIVQAGDSVSKIATVYGISSEELLKYNQGLNPSVISPGMVIKLPKSVENVVTESAPAMTTTPEVTYDIPTTHVTPETIPEIPVTPETTTEVSETPKDTNTADPSGVTPETTAP